MAEQEVNSKEKVHLIEAMVNKNLDAQQRAIFRIKARLEKLSYSDFIELAVEDLKNYTKDYEIIKGMIIFDDDLDILASDHFSKKFYDKGMLSTPPIKAWLQQNSDTVRFAPHGSTLNTETPIIIFSTHVSVKNADTYYIVALLDINLLVEERYLEYLSSYDTFIELAPNLFFSIGSKPKNEDSLEALTANLGHYISEKISIMGLVNYNAHIFLNNYDLIYSNASSDQAIIWLTFLFVYIFILVADASILLEKRAMYDELTGLLRMDALEEQLQKQFKDSKLHNLSFVLIKINDFSATYNSLGHKLSESLIKLVAERIVASVHNEQLVSRVDNDSFFICYKGFGQADLQHQVRALLHSLSKIYYLHDLELYLTASAGIDYCEIQHNVDIKLNLQHANIALAKAQDLGGNQLHFYQQAMEDEHNKAVKIRNNLQKAMENNQLEVFYQPIHSLPSNQIVAVESLVRWSVDGHWLSPAIFIPVAESTGQIIQLGEQVLDKVIFDIATTKQLQSLAVAVNFSAKQVQKSAFAKELINLLTINNINRKNFTVEVTESAFLEKTKVENATEQLLAAGLNVAIDDFGAGYSSLSSLAKQPANIIKIDREFTLGAHVAGKERDLLSTIIQVCLDLNKTVVVEGVENEMLIHYLAKYSELRIQGYYFSKPLPLNEFIDYVNKHEETHKASESGGAKV
ncbi:putative bifunctional diguanylate cyclase/phosphodiesterase [Pseudoalteromonas sp.]|uniref:putative bifunctional diguanylate cyclase/phosphodiesterase n=1 Tax=Pseudoalteromonas sp. TaxID=53249 RepID=UPI0035659271